MNTMSTVLGIIFELLPISLHGVSSSHIGAEAARVAHNHEDTGSKPVAGIHSNLPALNKRFVIAQATLNLSTQKKCLAL